MKNIVEIELTESAVDAIQELGMEGIFFPAMHSIPGYDRMIINLDLLRSKNCDIDPEKLETLITAQTNISAEQLSSASFVSIFWEL